MTMRDGVATIFVSDLPRSIRFYTDILGLRKTHSIGDAWVELKAESGFKIGLHAVGPESPTAGRHGSISLGLECQGSMEDHMAHLQSCGVTIDRPIVDGKNARSIFFFDPDGNELYLFQYASAQVEEKP
jgi:catechol 2,3-dioxygenase-like lactoylglutathione lyase family enzyme